MIFLVRVIDYRYGPMTPQQLPPASANHNMQVSASAYVSNYLEKSKVQSPHRRQVHGSGVHSLQFDTTYVTLHTT